VVFLGLTLALAPAACTRSREDAAARDERQAVPPPSSPAGSTALGAFSSTASMQLPRDAVEVVAVDGEVLAIGGQNIEGPLASAELWTEQDGEVSWEFAGRMRVPRVGHSATLLEDGRVLVVGGGGSHAQSRLAEIWTDGSQEEPFKSAGLLAVSRRYHTATRLSDGRVLVIGGRDPAGRPLATAEIWDPRHRTWRPAGRLEHGRCCHTATLLADGRVLVVGGRIAAECEEWDPNPPCLITSATAELWDPGKARFKEVASMPESEDRAAHTATRLLDGRVLVVGGAGDTDGEYRDHGLIWDPRSSAWTQVEGSPRDYHSATLLPSGRVLIFGGAHDFCGCCAVPDRAKAGLPMDLTDSGGRFVDSAALWDPASGAWLPAGWAAQPRMNHGAALLPDGRVLMVGGTAAQVEVPFDSRDVEVWRLSAEGSPDATAPTKR